MKTVESVIKSTHSSILLSIVRQVCPQAPAVKHWDNRAEPRYFRNPETLREAIIQAWQTGDFRQKRIIILRIDRGVVSMIQTRKQTDDETTEQK